MNKFKFGLMVVLAALLTAVPVWRVASNPVEEADDPRWSGSYIVDNTGRHRAAILDGRLKVDASGVSVSVGAIGHISSVLHVAGQGSSGAVKTEAHTTGALRAYRVTSCGTTVATLAVTNTSRRDILVNNIGTDTIYIGYGAAGHVALTAANGFPMHAMGMSSANPVPNHQYAILTLQNYQGPLSCISLGVSEVSIIEILK